MLIVTMNPKEHKRIFTKIIYVDKCWVWQGSRDEQGYGLLWYQGRTERIHRVIYAYFNGSIPSGVEARKFAQLDHICRNTACCNPNHLELVTQKENVLRGEGITAQQARKNVCKRGHELELARNGKRRWCRTCDRQRRK